MLKKIEETEFKKMAITVLAIAGAEEFEKQFPSIDSWCHENISPEDQDKLVAEMVDKVKQDQNVTITRDQFLTLYSYVQAAIGFEETMHRFPKLRLLTLNLLTQEDLDAMMLKIKQIEENLKEKYYEK